MLPGVFNLIAFALVPFTAYVVNGESGLPPPPPAHEHIEHHHKRELGGPGGGGGAGKGWGEGGHGGHGLPPPAHEHIEHHHKREFGGPGGGGGAGKGSGEGGHVGHGGHHKRNWQPTEVTRSFQTCQSQVSNYGPSFETACQNDHPEVLVAGLVDIRTSIVSLSAQVQTSVDAWATAEVHTCADSYVGLVVEVQVLLEIIHTHDRVDSCRDSILGLNVPLQALVSIFVNAGVDVGSLLGARVNLSLLSEIGISLGISLGVSAHV